MNLATFEHETDLAALRAIIAEQALKLAEKDEVLTARKAEIRKRDAIIDQLREQLETRKNQIILARRSAR